MLVKSVWQQLQDWTGGEESKDATDTIDGAVRGGAWGMKRGEDTPEGRFQGNATADWMGIVEKKGYKFLVL